MPDKTVVFSEGGINWCWYTKLTIHEDRTVTILRHWREYKGEIYSPDAKTSIPHPNYYHEQVWKECGAGNRIAEAYWIGERYWDTQDAERKGSWYPIRNSAYIFSYDS